MFDLPDTYRVDVKVALKDFIPKDLKPNDKKRIKDAVKSVRLDYQIAGEEIPSVTNEEYRCQVIQFYDIEVANIKYANFLASTYQNLIKPLCVIHMHDTKDEVYSMAVKRLSQTDDMQIVVEQTLLTDKYMLGINAVICIDGEEYKFFPYSDAFFDKPMVVDVINWLSTYEKAQNQYRQALNDMLKGKYDRQVVDSLRLALELFLKQFLGNDKSLENQVKDLGVYLKNKNLSSEVSNMFFKLIDCYAKYNNSHAKHDDSVDENELDFLLYLTGSFIRFLIKINNKNMIVADS